MDENKAITEDDIKRLKNMLNSSLSNGSGTIEKHNKKRKPKDKNDRKSVIPEEAVIQCRTCNRIFTLSSSEMRFYEKKGFQLPRRCKDCRDKGIMHSNEDYYDRGLKHNSYLSNLGMYGPRKNVSGGMDNSPGYFGLAKDKDGRHLYVRVFGENTEIVRFDYFKDWS